MMDKIRLMVLCPMWLNKIRRLKLQSRVRNCFFDPSNKDTSKTSETGEGPSDSNNSFGQQQLIFEPLLTSFEENCLLALEALVSPDPANKFNLILENHGCEPVYLESGQELGQVGRVVECSGQDNNDHDDNVSLLSVNFLTNDKTLHLVPPSGDHKYLFEEAHSGKFGAHLWDAKVPYGKLLKYYWWPRMHGD